MDPLFRSFAMEPRRNGENNHNDDVWQYDIQGLVELDLRSIAGSVILRAKCVDVVNPNTRCKHVLLPSTLAIQQKQSKIVGLQQSTGLWICWNAEP